MVALTELNLELSGVLVPVLLDFNFAARKLPSNYRRHNLQVSEIESCFFNRTFVVFVLKRIYKVREWINFGIRPLWGNDSLTSSSIFKSKLSSGTQAVALHKNSPLTQTFDWLGLKMANYTGSPEK